MMKRAILLLTILLAQPVAFAKVVEDSRYRFRADLPGIVSGKIEESDARGSALAWRTYTSSSPVRQGAAGYTAAVTVFETNSTDVRMLFEAMSRLRIAGKLVRKICAPPLIVRSKTPA